MILPQDDIPSNSALTYTDRLGLPLIPRGSTEALAAINAISRTLDLVTVNRTGDTLEGDFTFGNITSTKLVTGTVETTTVYTKLVDASRMVVNSVVASDIECTSAVVNAATISELTSTSGSIVNLSTTEVLATNIGTDTLSASNASLSQATITALTAPDITSTEATITTLASDSITSDVVEASTVRTVDLVVDNLTVKNKEYLPASTEYGIIADAYDATGQAAKQFHINMGFRPDVVKYTINIKGTLNLLAVGEYDAVTRTARYTVLDVGSTDSPLTGIGFPTNGGSELFALSVEEVGQTLVLRGAGDFDYDLEVPFDFSYGATIQLKA